MEQYNQIAQALLSALGYSATHNEARMKVLCRGADTDAGETILILEVRVRKRTAPLASNNKKQRGAVRGVANKTANRHRTNSSSQRKSPAGNLMKEISSRANVHGSDDHSGNSIESRLPGNLQSGVFTND